MACFVLLQLLVVAAISFKFYVSFIASFIVVVTAPSLTPAGNSESLF